MNGTIRRRSKGSWTIILNAGIDDNGKRRQIWRTVRGLRADAEKELRRLLSDMDAGAFVEPSKMTVAEYLEKWLTNVKATVATRTFERYQEIARVHLAPALGKVPLLKLQPLQIESYYAQALESGRRDGKGGLSRRTVLHHHRVLREALGRAVKLRLLIRNAADAVEPPKPDHKEMRALDQSAAVRLLNIAKDRRIYLPVLLAITTGMRRGEISGLRWTDVDLRKGKVSVTQSIEETADGCHAKPPKTAKGRRTIALPSLAVEALKAHKVEQAKIRLFMGSAFHDRGLVLCHPDGAIYAPDTITRGFRKLIAGTEFKGLRFHDLRHTHATQLLRQGVHPKIVSERLGHATIAITLDTYSHVMPGMQEDAAEQFDAALRAAMTE